MKTIKVFNQTIQLNFLFEEQFTSLDKYLTGLKPFYFINSHSEDYRFDDSNCYLKTKYYNLYKIDDKIVQLQKINDINVGIIVYDNNCIDLYLIDKNFQTEYLLSQYAFVYILNKTNNAILMHSSSVVYNDRAILLTAKSGTGKSTHARLWREYKKAITLNDDKNCVAYEDGKLLLYPHPWSGKHQIDTNIKAYVSCIVFLYQSKENTIKKLSKIEGMRLLLSQIERPNKNNLDKWNKIVDRLLDLPMYYYGCNISKEAVDLLYKRLEMDLCL